MDLHAPLGKDPPPKRRRLLPVAASVFLALGIAGIAAFFVLADSRGGQPYAVALIPPPPAAKPVASPSAIDPTPTASLAPRTQSADVSRIENGVKVSSPSPDAMRRPEIRDNGPMIIDVSKALDADARKFASNDRARTKTPAEAEPTLTAKATPDTKALGQSAQPVSSRPKVALFVGGLGLSEGSTRTATEIMPAAVALAFVPYGESLATSVAAARSKGHEILLQLPMQNAQGAPVGPHTLSAGAAQGDRGRDLDWLLSRFDGYVGVTNLLGAPVTSSSAAMTAILKGAQQHGAFYIDDGTSKRSLAPALAPGLGMRAVQADVVLDATNDAAAVRANLDKLAAIARKNGSAIGVASGLSDHLASIAHFAGDLDSRGLVLVPLSTLARDGASVATTR